MKVESEHLNIPSETNIYYSKTMTQLSFVTTGLAFIFSLYLALKGAWFGLLGILFTSYTLYSLYKKSKITESIIRLNGNGIKTLETGHIVWVDVKNTRVYSKRRNKKSSWFLELEYLDDAHEYIIKDIRISGLDHSPEQIEALIKGYQDRNRKFNG